MTARPRPRLSLSLNGLSARQLAARTWERMEGHDAMIWASAIAYYGAVATYRFGLDPDNHGIPLLTSLMDLAGTLCLILGTVLFTEILHV